MSIQTNLAIHGRLRRQTVLQRLAFAWIAAQLCVMCGCQTARVLPGGAPDADALVGRGSQAMREGNIAEAIACWKEAESDYSAAGRADRRFDLLIHLTAAYEAIGKYEEAERMSDQAAALVPRLHSPPRELSALLTQADLYAFTDREDAAEDVDDKGLVLSRKLGMTQAEAGFDNALGNLRVRKGKEHYADAVAAYQDSAALAEKCGDKGLQARALANAATAAALVSEVSQSVQFSHEAMAEISPMQSGREKLYLLLTVGQRLESPRPAEAERIYQQAAVEAQVSGDQQSLSYAKGYEGRLCRSAGRSEEALRLTREATFIAETIQNPQIEYQWQRQTGQILADQGNLDGAIAAYDSSINSLELVRLDLTLGKGNSTGATFRESVGPIYYELADLLLRRADSQSDSESRQALFRKARQTVEQLKSAQLEDYFQDRCEGLLKGRSREIEAVDPHTAVIYYISLPDRTETLISIGDQITRFKSPIGHDQLQEQTLAFRSNLQDRTSPRFRANARTLYDWLVRPLEPTLRDHEIDTLVFVPDGPLRTIPLAALQDGKDFLIARYAIAVTPGLTLMDPRPIEHRSPRVLEAGLSEAKFGYPPLPQVPEELENLKRLYGGQKLLDESFSESNLRNELDHQNYTIVHIASHVEFGDSSRSTYLVTYGKKLNLNEVESLVLPTRFRDQPLELLTLDCCNTAAGDERCTQGMAGVAIEAGARSAVATLWQVDDKAAPLLIGDFYSMLRNHPTMSKAKAMQHAQLNLLQDVRYQHPENWASYLVIGNWL